MLYEITAENVSEEQESLQNILSLNHRGERADILSESHYFKYTRCHASRKQDITEKF